MPLNPLLKLRQAPDGGGVFSGSCHQGCGLEMEVAVTKNELISYLEGQKVQQAFPNLSADEAEFLMSMICPACWDILWADEEED